MHRVIAGMKGRLGLLVAIAAVVAIIATLPLFGSTAYANMAAACKGGSPPPPCNQNNTVAVSSFRIPGGPVTRTTAGLVGNPATPFSLAVRDTAAFPPAGQILVSTGDSTKTGAEIMTYTSTTATTFVISERGPAKNGMPKKDHPSGQLVKLATTLLGAPGANAETTLSAAITGAAGGCTAATPPDNGFVCPGGPLPTPFTIGVPAAGKTALTAVCPTATVGGCAFSIIHQDVQTSNQLADQTNEMMKYGLDSACTPAATASQLCITHRAQQPATGAPAVNKGYPHKANGYSQPGPKPAPTGKTKISLHFQIPVKSRDGFFPASTVMVCSPTNPLSNCELMGYNNAASKIKTPSSTQLHGTNRCATVNAYKKSCASPTTRAAGDIVTGSDAQLVCRNRSLQPGVSPQPVGNDNDGNPTQAGTSVGITAVCYTQLQPNPPPKTLSPKQLNVPLVGQDLIVLNSLGQPFLSTGGFSHIIFGPVPYVDGNGPHDGTLKLISPCIVAFMPGVNLQVRVTLTVDKLFATTDTGTITVVLDTISSGATPGLCDDPAGSDDISITVYDAPGANNPNGTGDDDTDGDGCRDQQELQGGDARALGGLRDPWNAFDFYDIDANKQITLFGDIFGVANAFNQGPGGPQYTVAKDRGGSYGPFAHNLSEPDNIITLFGDIFSVAGQFNDSCTAAHP